MSKIYITEAAQVSSNLKSASGFEVPGYIDVGWATGQRYARMRTDDLTITKARAPQPPTVTSNSRGALCLV